MSREADDGAGDGEEVVTSYKTQDEAIWSYNGKMDRIARLSKRQDWTTFWSTDKKLDDTLGMSTTIVLDVEHQWMKNLGNCPNGNEDGGACMGSCGVCLKCDRDDCGVCPSCTGEIKIGWTHAEVLGACDLPDEKDGVRIQDLKVEYVDIDGEVVSSESGAVLNMCMQNVPGDGDDATTHELTPKGGVDVVTAPETTPRILKGYSGPVHTVARHSSGHIAPSRVRLTPEEARYFFVNSGKVTPMALADGPDNDDDARSVGLKWICFLLPLQTRHTQANKFEVVVLSNFERLWNVALDHYPFMYEDSDRKGVKTAFAPVVSLVAPGGKKNRNNGQTFYARVPFVPVHSIAALTQTQEESAAPAKENIDGTRGICVSIKDKCHVVRKNLPNQHPARHFDVNTCTPMLRPKLRVSWNEKKNIAAPVRVFGGQVAQPWHENK